MERFLHAKHTDEKNLQSRLHAGVDLPASTIAYSNITGKNVQQEINFKEMLDEIIESLKDQSKNNSVEIKVNIRNEMPFVSDKQYMKILLNTLISNTINYQSSATSKPYVYIKIHSHKIGTNILIRSNSIGVKKEAFEIFNVFYKGPQKSEEFDFGLYVVKETIAKLNGRIEVELAYEEGTEYNIHLPHL